MTTKVIASGDRLHVESDAEILHLHFHTGDAEQMAKLDRILANQAESKEREIEMVNRTKEFTESFASYAALVDAYVAQVQQSNQQHKEAEDAFKAEIQRLKDEDALEDQSVADAIAAMDAAKARIPTPTPPETPTGTGGDTGTGGGDTGSGTGGTGTDPNAGGGTTGGGVTETNPLT